MEIAVRDLQYLSGTGEDLRCSPLEEGRGVKNSS